MVHDQMSTPTGIVESNYLSLKRNEAKAFKTYLAFMADLTNPERRLLAAMQGRHGKWTLEEILDACNWDDQAIAVAESVF